MSVQLLTLLSVYVKEQRDCAFYSLNISRGVPMKMCQGYWLYRFIPFYFERAIQNDDFFKRNVMGDMNANTHCFSLFS